MKNPLEQEVSSLDYFFMEKALQEAFLSLKKDEVPIGALITYKNKIIAKAHNLVESLKDVTAHAEIQAIGAASDFLGGKYLKECSLYITLEPCMMCSGAIYLSQIRRVIFGAFDAKHGFMEKKIHLHPKTQVKGGVMQKECAQVIKDFFITKRGLSF